MHKAISSLPSGMKTSPRPANLLVFVVVTALRLPCYSPSKAHEEEQETSINPRQSIASLKFYRKKEAAVPLNREKNTGNERGTKFVVRQTIHDELFDRKHIIYLYSEYKKKKGRKKCDFLAREILG